MKHLNVGSGRSLLVRHLAIAVWVLFAGACSGDDQPAKRGPVISGVTNGQIEKIFDSTPTIPPTPLDTINASRQLHFTQAGVNERLTEVGLHPIDLGEVTQPFLGRTGRAYRIAGGEIQAYIYGDAVALGSDIDPLDRERVAPPNMRIDWAMPPSLIVSNNLALILLTRDDELKRRVSRAFSSY